MRFCSGGGAAVDISFRTRTQLLCLHLRRFLFHTALASGVDPIFPPFAAAEVRGAESLRPEPVFATRRGLGADKVKGAAGSAAEPATPFSPGFAVTVPVAPLAAKKVLLTETALNDFGLLTVEAVRT